MSPELLVGASSAVITPEPGRAMGGYASRASGATGVLDDLMCRTVVVQKGFSALVVVSLDLVYVPAALAYLIASAVADRLDIERGDVMVCATHTHCGPTVGATPDVTEMYERIAAAAVQCSIQARDAARSSVLLRRSFSIAGLVRSRREVDAPVDDTGSVVFAIAQSGEVVVSLVNLACHPTVLEGDTVQYSRDYPGAVCDTLEQICGGTAIFLQGFAGDVNPVFHDHSASDMQLFGKQIGARASGAVLDGLRDFRPAFTINLSQDAVLPVPAAAPAVPLDVDRLSATLCNVKVESNREPESGSTKRALDAAYGAEQNAGTEHERKRAVAIRQACWIDDLMASRSPVLGIDYPPPGASSLPVHVFRLGPKFRIIGFPGEPLSATARQLRTVLGDDLLLVGYANGAASYLPPEEAFDEHGYEVGSTRYAKGTVEKLAETAIRLAAMP